jgi:hypothetical protein
MNLTVSNAQIPLNELNKYRDMLVRNLSGKGKRRNKYKGKKKKKRFERKGGNQILKTKKNNIANNIIYIENNITLNNIIFNIVCYN